VITVLSVEYFSSLVDSYIAASAAEPHNAMGGFWIGALMEKEGMTH